MSERCSTEKKWALDGREGKDAEIKKKRWGGGGLEGKDYRKR